MGRSWLATVEDMPRVNRDTRCVFPRYTPNRDLPEYPVSSWGSAFALNYYGRVVFVCTAHQGGVEELDIHTKDGLAFVRVETVKLDVPEELMAGRDFDLLIKDERRFDIFIIVPTEPLPSNSRIVAPSFEGYIRPAMLDGGELFAVPGCPHSDNEIDYDTVHISETTWIVLGKFQGSLHGHPSCYTIDFEDGLEDYQGMSGSPVFRCFYDSHWAEGQEVDEMAWVPQFAGLVIQASKPGWGNTIVFIEGAAIHNALERAVNSVPRPG